MSNQSGVITILNRRQHQSSGAGRVWFWKLEHWARYTPPRWTFPRRNLRPNLRPSALSSWSCYVLSANACGALNSANGGSLALNASTLVCGWILVSLIFRHQDWSSKNQALAGVLFVFLIPVTLAVIFGFLRLLISPFLVYQDMRTTGAALLHSVVVERDQARDELTDLKATRPDFVLEWARSSASTWVGWDPRRRTTIALVWGRISFQNNGKGVAFD